MGKTRPRTTEFPVRTPLAGVDAIVARESFKHLAEALRVYLHAVGWEAVASAAHPRVQQQPHEGGSARYEFVVKFTGGKRKE